jgi:hypothetical protein
MRIRSIVVLVLGLILVSPVLATAQEESASPGESASAQEPAADQESAATQESATAAPGRRDLYLDMPYVFGGFDTDVAMTRGEEHFAVGDETRFELERMLDEVGADVEDMVSGYALVSVDDFFAFAIATRVQGVEPGSLLPAYLPILMGGLIDPTVATGNVAGRDVLIISSVGDIDEYVELYVYDEGDTIWMVQGSEDVVESTLESLPDPILPE